MRLIPLVQGHAADFYWFRDMQLIFYWFRDMRLISIGGGADEVMLNIICKTMGILPKPSKK
jgi:hypothetical protein